MNKLWCFSDICFKNRFKWYF